MYDYQTEKPKVFEDLPLLFSIRDQIRDYAHNENKNQKFQNGIRFEDIKYTGDSWVALACIDLLLELKQIRCTTIYLRDTIPTQHHRYTCLY